MPAGAGCAVCERDRVCRAPGRRAPGSPCRGVGQGAPSPAQNVVSTPRSVCATSGAWEHQFAPVPPTAVCARRRLRRATS